MKPGQTDHGFLKYDAKNLSHYQVSRKNSCRGLNAGSPLAMHGAADMFRLNLFFFFFRDVALSFTYFQKILCIAMAAHCWATLLE